MTEADNQHSVHLEVMSTGIM